MSGQQKAFYNTQCVPSDQLLNMFDADDVRLQLLRKDGEAKCLKYHATVVPDNDDKREDPIVFRLSEMYLTAAEAAWHLQRYADARNYVKAGLQRNIGDEKATAELAKYTDAELINLIRNERTKELCFEGHNLFDITRWKQSVVRDADTSSSVREKLYPSDYFILPIPQYELDANENMLPNPTVNK